MSLYVRVSCGYWTHRKTLRLSAILGPNSVTLPIRLWCYAAQNQPDGDFTKYMPEELALLLGYQADAQAMLEALQQAGFMKGMKVHAWEEHNAYHQTFSERARKAACARWEKKGKEKKGKEASIASSMLQASDGSELWKQLPEPLDTAEFRDAWKSWVNFRKEIKKRLTPSMVQEQWTMLGKLGSERSVSCIRQSIQNGWQGLFPEKNNNGSNGSHPTKKGPNI